MNKFYAVILVVIKVVMNGIRYNKSKFDFDVLEKRWTNHNGSLKNNFRRCLSSHKHGTVFWVGDLSWRKTFVIA